MKTVRYSLLDPERKKVQSSPNQKIESTEEKLLT